MTVLWSVLWQAKKHILLRIFGWPLAATPNSHPEPQPQPAVVLSCLRLFCAAHCMCCKVATSHTLATLSSLAMSTLLLSGDHAQPMTLAVCPSRVSSVSPVATSNTLALLSPLAVSTLLMCLLLIVRATEEYKSCAAG